MAKEFLDPTQVLRSLPLKEDMVAVDFGSGSGGWVLPLSQILEEGKVYAIDILEEPLSVLKGRMRSEGILNIETIQSDVEKPKGSTLPSESVDLVLMTNLLFQVDDKKAVFEEAKRILKKGGKILVVDWEKEASLGPTEKRVDPKEIQQIAENLGFKLEKEFKAGAYHWALIFSKKNL